jgi:general secretion pathway protein G
MQARSPFSIRKRALRRSRQSGLTLLELVMACGILMILATSAMPLARYTVKRQKEAELRRDLREMRDAIDRYKDAADRNLIRVEAGTEGYPPDLDALVNGVDLAGQAGSNAGILGAIVGTPAGTLAPPPGATPGTGSSATSAGSAIRHVRFLRRVPVDPMTGQAMWGMRSVSDDPESTSWGGKDVFDVFSMSPGTALDGSRYQDW